MSHMSKTDTPAPVLLSASLAAERLGVDRRTIHRWGKTGRLKPHKIGTYNVYDAEEVERVRLKRLDGAA